MSKAEQYIQGICNTGDWLTPGEAREAVRIAREEVIEKAVKWLYEQANIYTKVDVNRKDESIHTKFYADKMIDDFRKAMEKGD